MIRSSEPPSMGCVMSGLMVVLVLAGCGGDSGGKTTETQIAARVNKDDITVHQVLHVLQTNPRYATGQPESAARRVLDVLVDQELAAQAARAQGLEQDPELIHAMQAARREQLARAYEKRLAAQAVSASTDEIDRYYESNPALFSQRRIYTLQEALVAANTDEQERVRAIVQGARGAKEVEQRLTQAKLRVQTRQFAQPAEAMPPAVLQRLSSLEVGESTVVTQPDGARVLTLLHAESASVSRKAAGDAIAAYLLTERKRELVAQGMKSLRDAAKIEYLGTFTLSASSPASVMPAASASAR